MDKNLNFKYENDNFLKKINHLDEKHIGLIAKSSSYISPGDVLRFSYSGELVNVLVVKTAIWSPNGMFISSQANPLISCYKLDDVAEELEDEVSAGILKKILKAIYRNRDVASYKKVLIPLGDIIGENNFKTYNLQKCSTIAKITLDEKKLILDTTEFKKIEKLKKESISLSKKRKKLIQGLLVLEKFEGD
jgi:hypothetical protein